MRTMDVLEARIEALEQRWVPLPPPGLYWTDEDGPMALLSSTFCPGSSDYRLVVARFLCEGGGDRHSYMASMAHSGVTSSELRELHPLPMPEWLAGKPPTSTLMRVVFEDLAALRVKCTYYDGHTASCHLNNKQPPGLFRYITTWWRKTVSDMLFVGRVPEWLASILADIPMHHLWPDDGDCSSIGSHSD